MIVRLFALLLAAMLLAAPAQAQGGRRIALVIGNASYNAQVGRLDNPGRDADLIAGALRGRGFAVTVIKDAGRVALQQAVDRYAKSLGQAGPGAVGFFYYSGHGVANPENGRNYVVPVDAPSAGDDSLWYNSVELQQLVRTITTNAGEATSIVVFDACREVLALPKGKNLGAGYKGLERMAGVPSTLIAFSTSPGALAADRDRTAATGPYATELAKALGSSGADVRAMFDSVKFGVLQRTARKQVPWIEDGLLEQVFLGGTPVAATPAPAFTASKPTAVASGGVTSGPARWGLTPQDLRDSGWKTLIEKSSLVTRFEEARQAAEGGDAVAAFLLGGAYDGGIGVAKDTTESLRWMKLAAEGGQARAQVAYGWRLERGEGVAQDLAAAMNWYRRAVDQGQGQAMINLGIMYGKGAGVPVDRAAALALYRRAADAGMPWAMQNIGSYYKEGLSVPVDYALAMQWFRRSADLGLGASMLSIGNLYHYGNGVPQDRAQALIWYRKAAEKNEADGIANVGWYFLNGWGGPRDYPQAAVWSRRAAEAGSAHGALNLGFLYENGNGVAKDLAEAERWYRVALSRGQSDASDKLKRMGLKP